MKDIELALRDTLQAAASDAPPADTLRIDAMTAGTSSHRSSIIAAAAAAAVVLVTGTGLVLAVGGHLDEDGNRATSLGTPIVVATSTWKPGDGGDAALLTGTLRTTSAGCPYVDSSMDPAHPSPVALVWPAGYQARRAPGGGIEVTGPDGSVVIQEGDRFQAGGGYSESKGLPCTLGAAQAFSIQSSISRDLSGTPPLTDLGQPPDSKAVENDRVSRMTDQATKVAGTNSAAVLGGLHWDAQAQQLIIYVVNNSKADALQAKIDKAVGAVQGNYTHRFVRVERSYEELRNLAVAVMRDRKQWAGSFADELVSVGPDRATNGLGVTATGHVAELKDLLKARVGGVPVLVEQGARGTAL